jgi:CubicO group peptidase (beta-lactamase class C family)
VARISASRGSTLLLVIGMARGLQAQTPPAPHGPRPGAVRAEINVSGLSDSVRAILARGVRDSAFPGAIAVIGTRDSALVEVAVGSLDWKPSPRPTAHTLWDLASLTKVIALTTAMMQLVEAGKVDLDAPVQRYLTDWQGRYKDRVTVRHLLTHSSGLPSWRPLYKEANSPADALALALATPLDTTPGVRMVYSDIGAILLGQIAARVSGEPLDRYVSAHVFEPLGMRETLYLPPASLRTRIAPTEIDPWRQRHLRGEVHDENAYALGGVSAHAGLFSTAADLTRFARMYLNGGQLDSARIVSPQTIGLFTTVQAPGFSSRALGWDTATGSNSAGRYMAGGSFGHTGFTGTSLWIDPTNNIFVLLLTNRVNPTRAHTGISDVRISVADAAMGFLSSTPKNLPRLK